MQEPTSHLEEVADARVSLLVELIRGVMLDEGEEAARRVLERLLEADALLTLLLIAGLPLTGPGKYHDARAAVTGTEDRYRSALASMACSDRFSALLVHSRTTAEILRRVGLG
jgi:hypothetical protein